MNVLRDRDELARDPTTRRTAHPRGHFTRRLKNGSATAALSKSQPPRRAGGVSPPSNVGAPDGPTLLGGLTPPARRATGTSTRHAAGKCHDPASRYPGPPVPRNGAEKARGRSVFGRGRREEPGLDHVARPLLPHPRAD